MGVVVGLNGLLGREVFEPETRRAVGDKDHACLAPTWPACLLGIASFSCTIGHGMVIQHGLDGHMMNMYVCHAIHDQQFISDRNRQPQEKRGDRLDGASLGSLPIMMSVLVCTRSPTRSDLRFRTSHAWMLVPSLSMCLLHAEALALIAIMHAAVEPGNVLDVCHRLRPQVAQVQQSLWHSAYGTHKCRGPLLPWPQGRGLIGNSNASMVPSPAKLFIHDIEKHRVFDKQHLPAKVRLTSAT